MQTPRLLKREMVYGSVGFFGLDKTLNALSQQRNPAWTLVILLAIGHAVSDFYALLLSWLLPDFRDAFALNNTQVSWIVAVSGIFASMSQPAFGYAAEWTRRRNVYIALGTLLAGGTSLMGLASNVWAFVAVVLVGALGVGIFHPTAAAEVFEIVGPRDKIGRTLFAMTGGIGMALGPLLVMQIVACGGLRGTWVVFPPAVILAMIYAHMLPGDETTQGEPLLRWTRRGMRPKHLAVVGILFLAVILRSTAAGGMHPLIALRCDELGYDRILRGHVLALIAFFAFVGGMLGGYLTGRIGSKAIMLSSCFFGGPALFASMMAGGWLSWALLSFASFSLAFAMPHFLMTAQELMPERAGTVSGMMMGMAWSIAGLLLPIFGKISDVRDAGVAIKVMATLTIPAGIIVLFLKGSLLDAGQQEEPINSQE
ncbi:MAG: MFS transporter [Planctomycetota bacterium]